MRKRSGGSKPLDLSTMRELLRDRRTWVAHGVVEKPEGELHFEIADGDVMIEVRLADTGIPVTCRLAATCGIWRVPAVGTEVAVLIPKGEIDGDPVVIATLEAAPDQIADGHTVIVVSSGKTLLVHDGDSGACEPLVRKSEFDGHKHALPIIVAPNGNCTIGAPTPSPGDTGGAASVTGTRVLKSK